VLLLSHCIFKRDFEQKLFILPFAI